MEPMYSVSITDLIGFEAEFRKIAENFEKIGELEKAKKYHAASALMIHKINEMTAMYENRPVYLN